MLRKIYGGLLALFLFMIFPLQVSISHADPRMTGLPELTQAEIQWQNKHQKRVKKVKLNKIGLERVNEVRKKNGRWALTEDDEVVAPMGSEIIAAPGAVSDSTESMIPPADMPGMVDNSQLKYFPPIRSQGSLPTCGSFSGTYYTMTHMWAMANDLDARSGGDDFRLSPKWNNNMVNGGTNSGSWYYWCYDIGIKHGTATWAEFPYDSDYREWCLVPSTWYDAIYRRFDTYGYVNNTDTDTGIEQVKQLLLNGYVLNFPTYINSWQWTTIKDDPSTTTDDAIVGKSIAFWVNGTAGYHAMTVVGYNDNIWTDINGNGVVDNGEKGAFRIANSWGTGWKESGYCWMAYDALKGTSAVTGAPSAGRIDGWSPARAHWVTARANYTPQLVAEFTLNHAKRNQLRVTLGLSDIDQSQPANAWYPQMIAFDGGPYAFDGTTIPISGTFVFDFTDLATTASGQRWHLGLYDSTTGDPVGLYSYTLIDVANGEVRVDSADIPQSGDAGQLYTAIDYDASNGDLSPTADIVADPVSGDAPLTVSFDAGGSVDPDGIISAYHWDFGDGASASGIVVGHTYNVAGQFNAVLTVTDDAGALDTASVIIDVIDTNQAPQADITADPVSGDGPLLVSFDGSGSMDTDGMIVDYRWTFGDGSSASGMMVDHTYTQEGQFTALLTVTDDNGATDTSAVVITVTDPLTLNAPSSLSASASGNTVTLDWSHAGDNEDGFHIERAIKIRGKYKFQRVASVGPDATGYVDTVSETGSYRYRVQAYSQVLGISDYSPEASVTVSEVVTPDPDPAGDTFAAPSNLMVSTSGGTATLSWTDNTLDETGFNVERGVKVTGKVVFETIGQVETDQTTFSDACGTGTFYYRVQAYKADSVSGYSNQVTVRIK